jgi:hypothetical protein
MRRIFPCLLLVGCGALPPTGVARAQQSAQEFNLDSRFGRTEYVLERVAPSARDEYAAHHRAWGNAVQVADIELAGMKAKSDREVNILVRVAWYRADQQELRATTLEQTWRDKITDWELVGEKRIDGDLGLLGEPIVYAAPDAPRAPAQFPTIRLGNGPGDEDQKSPP